MKTKKRRKNWIYKGYSRRVSLHEIIKRSYLFCWINLGDEFPPNHITNITNLQPTIHSIRTASNKEWVIVWMEMEEAMLELKLRLVELVENVYVYATYRICV